MAKKRTRKRLKAQSQAGGRCRFCTEVFSSDVWLRSHLIAKHPNEAKELLRRAVRGIQGGGGAGLFDSTSNQKKQPAQSSRPVHRVTRCRDCDMPAIPGEDVCYAHHSK